MNITTVFEINSEGEFKEAVERLGGECAAGPTFETERTIYIVDEEEWEDPDEEEEIEIEIDEDVDHDEDNPADHDPSPFPDDEHRIE